jgi:biopolymer transport protein ExbB
MLNAFKAAMERGLVEENRKLNAWMVILTMAISGGPFLGLLGTVFGVMNTFAAMADAGEANLAAIAPGVASALAATVSGLLVAIPALFAYNYLAAKIKTITAEMTSFVDYFSLKVEGALGGNE